MGRGEPLDTDEIRSICEYCLRGYSDEEIQRTLGRGRTDYRDLRTIRNIRRIFVIAQDVLREQLDKLKSMQDSLPEQDINKIIEIVDNVSKGRRPVVDKDTGEIKYESFIEL